MIGIPINKNIPVLVATHLYTNDNNIALFDMNASRYEVCYCKVFWSKTIAGLYCTISVFLLLLGLFLYFKDCITIYC